MNSVLVVDDDQDIAHFIELTMQVEGFDVRIAHDGSEGLAAAAHTPPDIVLLDVMMPGMDGVEVCRRLRSDPRTAQVPVIMLTARSGSSDKVAALQAGADDYVVKPFDPLELVARVRSTLRRNAEMRAISPLTGLPGNHRINEEIAARAASGQDFAVCHCDLDNFKAFNDHYGWLRGDDVISLLAGCLKRAGFEVGPPVPFVGHVGGDDFVVICNPDQVERLCEAAIRLFDTEVPVLYDPVDAAEGGITLLDRQGAMRRYPIVSLSIGVATTGRRVFRDYREIVAIATEMKSVAKRQPGSAVAVDRRADGVAAGEGQHPGTVGVDAP